LPDNSYTYDGATYQLKQHGFARESVWQVVGNTDHSLTIALTANASTLANYPFDFRLQFTYTVGANNLLIEQEITNLTDRVMPFSVGFHPYFAMDCKDSINLNISAQKLWNNVHKVEETYTGKFDFSLPEIDNALYLDADCRSMTMTSAQGTLTIKFDENYRVFVVWTVQGKNFICLEPWTGGRNAMNTGENLIHLPPQTTKSMVVAYEVHQN
jgi:galactose mutarotase-like enzyme